MRIELELRLIFIYVDGRMETAARKSSVLVSAHIGPDRSRLHWTQLLNTGVESKWNSVLMTGRTFNSNNYKFFPFFLSGLWLVHHKRCHHCPAASPASSERQLADSHPDIILYISWWFWFHWTPLGVLWRQKNNVSPFSTITLDV